MEKKPESVVRVSSSMEQKGSDFMVKPVEKKDQAKKQELPERNHRRESSDKPLDKSEPKNISKKKKEEKTEVVKKSVEEIPKLVEGGPRLKERELDFVDARNFGVQDLPRAGVKNLTTEGILGKRKYLETNGLLYGESFPYLTLFIMKYNISVFLMFYSIMFLDQKKNKNQSCFSFDIFIY